MKRLIAEIRNSFSECCASTSCKFGPLEKLGNSEGFKLLIDPELFTMTEANSCAITLYKVLFGTSTFLEKNSSVIEREIEILVGEDKFRNLDDVFSYCIEKPNKR